MWTLLKLLLLRWAFARAILKALGALAFFIPVALILKTIGLPLLIVLLILAVPVFVVLTLLGLPLLLVFLCGSMLLGVVMAALTMGLALLKILLPILLLAPA